MFCAGVKDIIYYGKSFFVYFDFKLTHKSADYNSFLVYCRELAPGTVSLTGDRAQGDVSKHDSHYILVSFSKTVCKSWARNHNVSLKLRKTNVKY